MGQKIKNISIERIRKAVPEVKGIGNDVLIDHSEYYISDKTNPIYKYPLRLDGLLIVVREKGESRFSINLKEFSMIPGDIVICSPGDLLQSVSNEGIHQSQTIMISSDFLKEMYIGLNSFMPFFTSQKEHPVFHLTENEVKELGAFYQLVEESVGIEDYFQNDIVKRLLAAYLYKLGSILYRHRPELQAEAAQPLKREEILFKQFINLLAEHHCKERRVDFYADQLFLSPKHFSTVIKKVSGKTAGEWIDEYVILEIKTLLKYSPMSIQEVAYYMNFPNPSFFGKYFKHHTGMSPSEYKAQA
ncbi:MAG: AraC family transcriptional regulator [Bacteroides sp.]|nr:AraC family transcriptional regulator [Bacteroidaceae bacterium]MBP3669040.1 AraC family transcriptional regulator [Bacteroides sp.]